MKMPAIGARVYEPRRSKQWKFAVVCLLVGLLGLLALRDVWLYWNVGGPAPDSATFIALLCLLGLPLGVAGLVNALRGLPRLTVTPEGLKLDSSFGGTWAKWNSLGAFALTARSGGRFNRRVLSGTAEVTGTEVSAAPLKAKRYTVPDAFLTPVDAIVHDLNAERTLALGISDAPPLPQAAPEIAQFGLAGSMLPWLTYTLLAILVAIFAAEQVFAVTPGAAGTPSIDTLIAMGGLSRNAVMSSGEWYRLFTAPLLHASVVHLFGNGIALLLGGRLFERLVGRWWFVVILVLGALGGSLMSITVNPATMISVGASGALMAMFAAMLVGSFRVPAGSPLRQRLQILSFQVLVPSMLPFLSISAGGHVDYGAHLGGALTGAVISLLLLMTWRSGEPVPPFRPIAAGISMIGIVTFAASVAIAAVTYPKYDVVLIPMAELPKSNADVQARAAVLVAHYPRDPRAHLYLGGALAAAGDNAGAERELRTALVGAQKLSTLFSSQLEFGIRGVLAALLAFQHKDDEAKEIARPVCSAAAGDPSVAKSLQALVDQHLCN